MNIDYITGLIKYFTDINTVLGILIYWVPLLFCSTFYFIRTCRNYIHDKNKRVEAEQINCFYYPTDTIGDLIGRGVVSIVPIANLLAAVFDLAPEVFGKFFKYLEITFNQPLVPKRKK